MPLTRVIPLALVLGGFAIAQSTNDRVPGIFAPALQTHDSISPAAFSGPALLPRLLTSERLRALISARVMERAEPFSAPGLNPAPSDPRMVLMEKFVVESTPLRVIELHAPDPPLWNFVKTGNLYRIRGEKVTAEANMRFFIIESVGTRGKEYTRAELQFGFTW